MTWDAVLDEMECRIQAGHRLLAEDGDGPGDLVIPDGIGPLPAHLRDRAEAVFVATVELEDHLTAAMADMARHLGQRRSVGEMRPVAAFVDRRA